MGNKKILIVEDEGIQAMSTKLTLLKLGYEVLPIAISGKSAIKLASTHNPDLILMDIRLRGTMDGIEAATAIRENGDMPVVFISAYADDKTMDRAKQASPVAFLEKPVTEASLNKTIRMALGSS